MATELKVLRAKHNLSQQKLAEALDTKQANVSAWETGRSVPRPPMMQKIADYFGVSKEKIFFDAFNYSK